MGHGDPALRGDSDGQVSRSAWSMAAASADLAEMSGEMRRMRDNIATGGLRLDEDAARKLLASLSETESRVQRMIVQADSDLDRRLRLGDNPIGHTMSERFQGAASGGRRSARPVLEDFAKLLEDLETTVRQAAGLYVAADDDVADRLSTTMRDEDSGSPAREERR